jgi:hypothetical protein
MVLGLLDSLQDLVGNLHGHATEVRDKMRTLRVTSKTAFVAFLRRFSA